MVTPSMDPAFSPQATSRKFSPTRLATTLTSSSPPLPTSTGKGDGAQVQGFIVLETNYRLYAYTGKFASVRTPRRWDVTELQITHYKSPSSTCS